MHNVDIKFTKRSKNNMRTLSPFTQCTVVKQMKLNTRSTKSTANALECDGLSNSEKNPSQVSGLFRPGGIFGTFKKSQKTQFKSRDKLPSSGIPTSTSSASCSPHPTLAPLRIGEIFETVAAPSPPPPPTHPLLVTLTSSR